jgi:hypothetical protein
MGADDRRADGLGIVGCRVSFAKKKIAFLVAFDHLGGINCSAAQRTKLKGFGAGAPAT